MEKGQLFIPVYLFLSLFYLFIVFFSSWGMGQVRKYLIKARVHQCINRSLVVLAHCLQQAKDDNCSDTVGCCKGRQTEINILFPNPRGVPVMSEIFHITTNCQVIRSYSGVPSLGHIFPDMVLPPWRKKTCKRFLLKLNKQEKQNKNVSLIGISHITTTLKHCGQIVLQSTLSECFVA